MVILSLHNSLLMEHGIEIDAVDENGDTPLSFHLKHKIIKSVAVEMAIILGANKNFVDKNGDSLFHIIIDRAAEDAVYALCHLIERKANMNILDAKGRTPLAKAIELGTKEIVKILTERGASTSLIE